MPGEEMDYQFREIRKGERDAVLGFAQAQGCSIRPEAMRHNLSLMVKAGDDPLAVALCVEQSPGCFVIEIAHADEADDALITELTDRCLRKMQSDSIASARISSPVEKATQTIWQSANWLDHIQETPPPADPQAA